MAEVSGAHYLYNTTVENRLFLRLPVAHTSRKNGTHCPLERREVACPIPQAGMDMEKSESVRAGGGEKNQKNQTKTPTAATELIDMTNCAMGMQVSLHTSVGKANVLLCFSGTKLIMTPQLSPLAYTLT